MKRTTKRPEPAHDIWKDYRVQERLKEGKPAYDIMVMDCPKCSEWNYYNEGSHFYCRFCKKSWICLSDGEPREGSGPRLYVSEHNVIALSDTVTVCTEDYDNRTLPS